MGAYAALLSLSQTLKHTLIHDPHPNLFPKEQLVYKIWRPIAIRQLRSLFTGGLKHTLIHDPHPRQQLVSLQENVTTLLTFLQQHSHVSNESMNHLESRIIDVAFDAEDTVEFPNPASMQQVLQEIDSILEEAAKIKVNHASETAATSLVFSDPAISSNSSNSSINTAILKDDFVALRDRIYGWSTDLEVIPIFGMGGIGKSTLATRLYEDCAMSKRFDRRFWIVVSQDYSLRKILLGIVQSMQIQSDGSKSVQECSDGELKVLIHKELYNRRYLFVVDDVWSTEAWEEIHRMFPNHKNGSRVLVTTRSSHVAGYAGSSPHEVKLLNEGESWSLLQERVFGNDSCPSNLRDIGMKVAKNCHGLPLLVTVVAGLLQRNIAEEYWRSFSGKISSAEPTIELQCSKVLSLSYDNLPVYLKPCFLYVTIFPEDSRIKVNRLISLWMAEGFVEQSGSKEVEEVAEGYIDDLVGRSLLLVSSRKSNGRIKAVTVHDTLREIGTQRAEKERFCRCHSLQSMVVRKQQRRLSIRDGSDLCNFSSVPDPMTRSLLVSSSSATTRYTWLPNVRLLKVLDSPTELVKIKPKEVVYLRYLAVHIGSLNLEVLSNVLNLQTLFIGGGTFSMADATHTLLLSSILKRSEKYSVFHLPLKVWKMPSLRHINTKPPFHLEQPCDNEIVEESNLQTLSVVENLVLSSETIKRLANVKKLGLYYCMSYGLGVKNDYQLSNLIRLQKIEALEIIFRNVEWSVISKMKFPSSLKKLTFDCQYPRGDHDANVVVLDLLPPNVEVLKLRGGGIFVNRQWSPVEGQFEKLRYLELRAVNLKHWETESIHFPSLEILVLWYIRELEEIPSGIGEIDSLQLIRLDLCEPVLVDSAHQIRAAQQKMGNSSLQVIDH